MTKRPTGWDSYGGAPDLAEEISENHDQGAVTESDVSLFMVGS